MNTEKTIKDDKIPFKRYFEGLTADEKRTFFFNIGPYASVSHIYACMRDNYYTMRLRLAIESVTNIQFNWNDEV